MAYTTDRTWVTGEVVTAAYFNTYLRDNVKWLSTDKGTARATQSATQSILNSSWTSQTFNTNVWDNASIHSTSANTERFTIPTGQGGKWMFGGSFSFAPNATGVRYGGIYISYVSINVEHSTLPDGAAATNAAFTMATTQSVTAAQHFNLTCWQSSGGALNVNAGASAWALWVGW